MNETNLIKRKKYEFIYNNKNTLLTILLFSFLFTLVNIIITGNFNKINKQYLFYFFSFSIYSFTKEYIRI